MNLRKLKKWFRRHRQKARAVQAPSSPATHRSDPTVSPPRGDGPPAKAPAAKKPASKVPPSRKTNNGRYPGTGKENKRPVSRQGIPILKPDEDLSHHFSDVAAEGKSLRTETEEAGGVSQRRGRTKGPSVRPKKSIPLNRQGIRRLDDDADLHAHFMSAGNDALEEKGSRREETRGRKQADRDLMADIPTDRHGIPRLDNQADLKRLFDAAVDESQGGEALGETLRQSLAHDARGLMKEKTGGFFPTRRLSLKEKLRRYPSPQAQLDLHGFTASKARQRADAFIRTAQADGLFTLNVIVGKGLHSEGGAVLPDVIEDLLMDLKREDIVLAYRWEKRSKRKSGAVIVFLTPHFA